MDSLLLPSKIIYTPNEKNKHAGSFVIEPCYYGYGRTLGNALRRVLLSSLPGAAVTAVKIQGVTHEFSTLPNVKEDIIEILLNLKLLRMQVFSSEPVTLRMEVTGEKKVTAKDFEKNADVRIVNPTLHIATLTSPQAELIIDITVNQGRGYVPVESREKEKLDLGVIAIDAIYTPIVNVGFKVENTRVGQITNYDKLLLTIETDGTITPEDAFQQAVEILLNHFDLLKNYSHLQSNSEDSELSSPSSAESSEASAAPSADSEDETGER